VTEELDGKLDFLALLDEPEAPAVEAQIEQPGLGQQAVGFFGDVVARPLLKGALSGAQQFMQAFGPLPVIEPATEEFVGREVPPAEIREQFQEFIGEMLPTAQEGIPGAIAGGVERSAEILAMSLGLPGMATPETAIRSLFAGTAGQVTEELGGGPIAQTIAESAAFLAPDPRKLANLTKRQKELVEVGEKFGLTAEELTPALVEQTPVTNTLARFGKKGQSVQERLQSTRKAVGRIYDGLKKGPGGTAKLAPADTQAFSSSVESVLKELPERFRTAIKADLDKFITSEQTGADLITLWQATTDQVAKGNRQLGLLKNPIQAAMTKIAPELASDFAAANQLFSQQAKLAQRLKPGQLDQIIGRLENLGAFTSVAFGHYGLATEIVGQSVARRLATEALTNPRFLNPTRRFADALIKGNKVVAQRALKDLKPMLTEIDPDLGAEIEALDLDVLFPVVED